METQRPPLLVLGAAVVLIVLGFLVDRVLLWAEDWGLLFYRRSRLTPRDSAAPCSTPSTWSIRASAM